MAYQFTQTGAEIQDILDNADMLGQTYTSPSINQGRASNLSGGFIQAGNIVIVSLQFTSNGGNLMAYLTGFPVPAPSSHTAILSATSTSNNYSSVLNAIVLSDGSMAVTAHTNGDVIIVSGAYITA